MNIYIVDNEHSRLRLDVYAGELLPEVSRAYIHRLCDSGRIAVDGKSVKAGYKLKVGDKISVDYDPKETDNIPSIKLPIIYEDKSCIVINKPVSILTHARGKFDEEATVSSFLRNYVNGMTGDRAGIVHRLDRATSGVIICAKDSQSLSLLQKQFSQRKVKKKYIAIVRGRMKEEEALIDMPIERNPKSPSTFRVGINGKHSQTQYKVIKTNGIYSMIELSPTTGRTHQIRVHLAYLGHPIVGDTIYGGDKAERLYLHALSLEITLPSNKRAKFEAPMPGEFETIMEIHV